ncbi:Protein of unknown function [Cotesia congregata]|uniref:Mutator-like transposase domain-containing protein n=1 Tax=Cotesia congregata TaxID=51543 RepID=A0A8J2HMY3_COTCN|nr:Protein of unknown function [Cotesia congregata]
MQWGMKKIEKGATIQKKKNKRLDRRKIADNISKLVDDSEGEVLKLDRSLITAKDSFVNGFNNSDNGVEKVSKFNTVLKSPEQHFLDPCNGLDENFVSEIDVAGKELVLVNKNGSPEPLVQNFTDNLSNLHAACDSLPCNSSLDSMNEKTDSNLTQNMSVDHVSFSNERCSPAVFALDIRMSEQNLHACRNVELKNNMHVPERCDSFRSRKCADITDINNLSAEWDSLNAIILEPACNDLATLNQSKMISNNKAVSHITSNECTDKNVHVFDVVRYSNDNNHIFQFGSTNVSCEKNTFIPTRNYGKLCKNSLKVYQAKSKTDKIPCNQPKTLEKSFVELQGRKLEELNNSSIALLQSKKSTDCNGSAHSSQFEEIDVILHHCPNTPLTMEISDEDNTNANRHSEQSMDLSDSVSNSQHHDHCSYNESNSESDDNSSNNNRTEREEFESNSEYNSSEEFQHTSDDSHGKSDKSDIDESDNISSSGDDRSEESEESQNNDDQPINELYFQEPEKKGRRISDIFWLMEELHLIFDNHSSCPGLFKDLQICKVFNKGLRSLLTWKCKKCGKTAKVWTDPEQPADSMNLNEAATLGTLISGTGFTSLEEQLTDMNIPCLVLRNKACTGCERNSKHNCVENWGRDQTSTSMETDIITEGFRNSIEMHELIYKYVVGDGDSSVYKSIIDNDPYAEYSVWVEKIECKNHLFRNFCDHVEEVAKKTKLLYAVNRGSVKGIHDDIKASALKMRVHIEKAMVRRKDEVGSVQEKTSRLLNDINNTPCHIFEEHRNCEKNDNGELNEICKSISKNNVEFYKKIGMFQEVENQITRLALNVSSLLINLTSNAAELYNSMANKFHGGRRVNNSMSNSFELRALCAMIQFNNNPVLSVILNYLELPVPAIVVKMEESRHKQNEYTRKYRENGGRKRRRHYGTDKDYGPFASTADVSLLVYNLRKDDHLKKLKERQMKRDDIQKETVNQSTCSNWYMYRADIITASHFGEISQQTAAQKKAALLEKKTRQKRTSVCQSRPKRTKRMTQSPDSPRNETDSSDVSDNDSVSNQPNSVSNQWVPVVEEPSNLLDEDQIACIDNIRANISAEKVIDNVRDSETMLNDESIEYFLQILADNSDYNTFPVFYTVISSLKTPSDTNHDLQIVGGNTSEDIIYKKVTNQGNDFTICGVYAAAFATSIALGEDPSTVNYSLSSREMRDHLIKIIQKKKIIFVSQAGYRMSKLSIWISQIFE